MFAIIGILVVFGAVAAGYLMEHGNLQVLMQPAELAHYWRGGDRDRADRQSAAHSEEDCQLESAESLAGSQVQPSNDIWNR